MIGDFHGTAFEDFSRSLPELDKDMSEREAEGVISSQDADKAAPGQEEDAKEGEQGSHHIPEVSHVEVQWGAMPQDLCFSVVISQSYLSWHLVLLDQHAPCICLEEHASFQTTQRSSGVSLFSPNECCLCFAWLFSTPPGA